MIDTARRYSAALLAVDRRIAVAGSILAIILLAGAVFGQMRLFT